MIFRIAVAMGAGAGKIGLLLLFFDIARSGRHGQATQMAALVLPPVLMSLTLTFRQPAAMRLHIPLLATMAVLLAYPILGFSAVIILALLAALMNFCIHGYGSTDNDVRKIYSAALWGNIAADLLVYFITQNVPAVYHMQVVCVMAFLLAVSASISTVETKKAVAHAPLGQDSGKIDWKILFSWQSAMIIFMMITFGIVDAIAFHGVQNKNDYSPFLAIRSGSGALTTRIPGFYGMWITGLILWIACMPPIFTEINMNMMYICYGLMSFIITIIMREYRVFYLSDTDCQGKTVSAAILLLYSMPAFSVIIASVFLK